MALKNLPETYFEWLPIRELHLIENLQKSEFTLDLFKQYKKHLGIVRYTILINSQQLLVPAPVKKLLQFNNFSFLSIAIPIYKISRIIKMDKLFKNMLLPSDYKIQIKALDVCT